MTQKTATHLARFAKSAIELEKKRVLTINLETKLNQIEAFDQVILGERALLKSLQNLLNRALEIIKQIENTQDTKISAKLLSDLETLLSDVSWELSMPILDDLTKRIKHLEKEMIDYELKIHDCEQHISEFSECIAEAQIARAPIFKEVAEAKKLQAIIEIGKRKLREKNLDELPEVIDQLKEHTDNLKKLSDGVSKKTQQVKNVSRRADLLLLRSPLVNRSYKYTVLLRTPSKPGTHGINIQAESTIVEKDWQNMRNTIDDITKSINLGLARQFKQKNLSPPKPIENTEKIRNFTVLNNKDQVPSSQNIDKLIGEVGDLMYRLFMPERMQEYLYQTPCSITITTNDLELPWELMCYDNNFICLNRPIARLPMGEAFPRRERKTHSPSEKLRFLLIFSDEDQHPLPAAEKEIDMIKAGLEKGWEKQIEIKVLKRDTVTGRELNKILRSGMYDVIHYAGHGVFNTKQPEQSGLLLSDNEVFFAQKFRRLLEGHPLVFLNACESGRSANEKNPQKIDHYLWKEPAEGLAKAVIYGGALGCIGALWPIYDDAATEFAIHYYNKVLEGYMIGEALRKAREHIHKKYPNQITWAAFVLYGDPTYRLVETY